MTNPPPIIDIAHAAGRMISACANMSGKANPVTTTEEVMKRPRSTGPDPSSAEKSSLPQRAKIAFGRGAATNVRASKFRLDHIDR